MTTAPPTHWPDTPAGPAGAVLPALFELIDDAALFPPGNAAMPAALAGHRAHHAGPYGDVVGRFLCPASRIPELRAVLDIGADRHHPLAGAAPIRVAVVADTGAAGLPRAMADVAADPRLVLEAVEVSLPATASGSGRAALIEAIHRVLAAVPTALPAYVELPLGDSWEVVLDVLSGAGRGAKLRTGGATAAAFPTEAQVAAVLTACSPRQVPLKCTAGLHRAVRHRDPQTGFEHHGFLNLLVAAARARAELDPMPALSERDGPRLAAEIPALPADVRKLLVGFGSCSIDEPVADLRALGLL
ncbi:MAG TPA: hypothetical protein VMU51_23595 [Mycobacteriales bacterium]|nr:hypothetical protein [Mycobacteriales bacterium]